MLRYPRAHVGGEGGIQAAHRIHDAQAIRPDQAHSATAHLLQNLALEFLAVFAVLFESRGNNNRAAHARGHALANHAGYGIGGRDNDGEIDGLRNLLDVRVGLDSQDTRTFIADG